MKRAIVLCGVMIFFLPSLLFGVPQYGGIIRSAPYWAEPASFDRIDNIWQTEMVYDFTHDTAIRGNWYIDRKITDYRFMWDARNLDACKQGGWASSWEIPNDKTYVFHVRKGIRWQKKPPVNGRMFVADDVVYTFKRLLAAPVYKGHSLQNIETITAPDQFTVIFKTKVPFYPLLEEIGAQHIVAHEVVEKYGDLRDWRATIGTGPFTLEDYVAGSYFKFRRNPDYWEKDPRNGNQLPYVDGVDLLIIPEEATRLAALKTGKLDLDEFIMWQQKETLKAASPELQWAANQDANVFQIFFKNNTKPWDNLKVRQAMSMAINRQEIADTVFPKGAGRIMDYVIPKRVPDEYTPFDQLPPAAKMVRIYDPVAAKKLLAEAGYPNGFKAKVQYITASDTAWGEDALLMVKNYWAKIGVDLGLQRVDAGTMGAFRTPPYPYDGLMAADAGGTIYPILYNYHYTGAVANRCIISDPYIDKMIDQIKVQVVDVKKRDALIKEVFAYIMGQSYYIAFPQGETYTGWWPWLKEYSGEISIQGESLGPIFSHISLDQDLRAKMTGRKE